MSKDNNPNDSIKLSKDEREFYESIRAIFDEPIVYKKAVEKIIKETFQEVSDYYSEEMGKGLNRKQIHDSMKPMYRGSPYQLGRRIESVIIDGMLEDAFKK